MYQNVFLNLKIYLRHQYTKCNELCKGVLVKVNQLKMGLGDEISFADCGICGETYLYIHISSSFSHL